MALKFYNRNIYEPGTLYNLYQGVKEAKQTKTKVKNRLQEQELSRLVEIYAAAQPGTDLLAIDNDQILETPEGNKVTGRDFKAMVRMVYEYARGDYSDIKQVENTSFNCAVPLGLLAYKNFYNKSYNDFRLDPKLFEITEYFGIRPSAAEGGDLAIKAAFNLDLLLGKALASTSITQDGTMVEWNTVYGLASLCALDQLEKYPLNSIVIKEVREASFGRRRGHYLRGYGANNLNLEDWPEDNHPFLRLYNSCNQTIKHLLLQRWIYYMPRNSNMITNLKDWDKPIKSIDDLVGNMKPLTFNNDTAGDLFGL